MLFGGAIFVGRARRFEIEGHRGQETSYAKTYQNQKRQGQVHPYHFTIQRFTNPVVEQCEFIYRYEGLCHIRKEFTVYRYEVDWRVYPRQHLEKAEKCASEYENHNPCIQPYVVLHKAFNENGRDRKHCADEYGH